MPVSPDLLSRLYGWSANIGASAMRIVFILLGAWAVTRFFRVFIDRSFRVRLLKTEGAADQRLQTLSTLLSSVSRYVVYFVAGIMVLEELGVRTSSLLAGAGIVGLTVGFGAQNLVKDIISGFFIVFENQYAVGDYIQAGGVSGIVEELGLRMTRLRDWGGEVHTIPNGEITKITNLSRGNMRSWVDITVGHEERLDRVMEIIQGVAKGVARDMPTVAEGPEVLGVTAIEPAGVTISIVAKTRPMEQWAVEREMRKRLKLAFEEAGIVFPYPHQVVIQSQTVGRGGAKGGE